MPGVGSEKDATDDVGRAKKFYQSLPGWKIEPDITLGDKTLEWQNIINGEPEPGTMNEGGFYKRMEQEPIITLCSSGSSTRSL